MKKIEIPKKSIGKIARKGARAAAHVFRKHLGSSGQPSKKILNEIYSEAMHAARTAIIDEIRDVEERFREKTDLEIALSK